MTMEELRKYIKEIQYYKVELFEALDEDYPDYRIVRNKEKAIYNRLYKITDDKVLQEKIRLAIQQGMWNTEDYTFKPIFDNLREIGIDI